MSSIDTLKDNLMHAVDAEYNVIKADIVLDIICQLEKMEITKEQLQKTRLGREINTMRQKIDGRKTNIQQIEKSSELFIEISQRAKKLLRSWQSLLNTSQTSSINEDIKPRLILKVKLNSSLTKRKHDSYSHSINRMNIKRKKLEINNSLPRLKTTQELLLEIQMNERNILLTKTSIINDILEKKILDQSLKETIQFDYSTLHHEKDFNNIHTNSNYYQKQLSSSSVTSTTISKRQSFIQYSSSSNTNLENDSNADSPISISSSSSITTIEKLHQSFNFIALPFIDCPMEFDLILDELIV